MAVQAALKVPRDAASSLLFDVLSSHLSDKVSMHFRGVSGDFRDVLPRIRLPTLCIGAPGSHLQCMPWIAEQMGAALALGFQGKHFMLVEEPEPWLFKASLTTEMRRSGPKSSPISFRRRFEAIEWHVRRM